MVCLHFCQHSDVTFLKEFQQCLNLRYTSHLLALVYILWLLCPCWGCCPQLVDWGRGGLENWPAALGWGFQVGQSWPAYWEMDEAENKQKQAARRSCCEFVDFNGFGWAPCKSCEAVVLQHWPHSSRVPLHGLSVLLCCRPLCWVKRPMFTMSEAT